MSKSSNSDGLLDDIAETEVTGASKLRMLSTVLTAANTIALIAILLYLADLYTATEALRLGFGATVALFAMHLVVSRLPAMARAAQQHTVKRPDSRHVDIWLVSSIVATIIFVVSGFLLGPEKMARLASVVGRYSPYFLLLGGVLFLLSLIERKVEDAE